MKNEINRIDIEIQNYLKPNQYCLLDYLIYKSNLDRWNFNITNIVKNTSLSRGAVHRTLVNLVERGWATKNSENQYIFNREVFLKWMERSKIEKEAAKRVPAWNVESSKMEQPVPNRNDERSTVEHTNRKEQIGITNKKINRAGDILQNGTAEVPNKDSGVSAKVAPDTSNSTTPPAAEIKKETDSVTQITATKSVTLAAPAPIVKYSQEYYIQMLREQQRNKRLYGSPFGRR
jgi:predicted transcriptional regulator